MKHEVFMSDFTVCIHVSVVQYISDTVVEYVEKHSTPLSLGALKGSIDTKVVQLPRVSNCLPTVAAAAAATTAATAGGNDSRDEQQHQQGSDEESVNRVILSALTVQQRVLKH